MRKGCGWHRFEPDTFMVRGIGARCLRVEALPNHPCGPWLIERLRTEAHPHRHWQPLERLEDAAAGR